MPGKQDDPEQSKRFIETARALGASESSDAFEKVLLQVVRKSPSHLPAAKTAGKKKPSRKR